MVIARSALRTMLEACENIGHHICLGTSYSQHHLGHRYCWSSCSLLLVFRANSLLGFLSKDEVHMKLIIEVPDCSSAEEMQLYMDQVKGKITNESTYNIKTYGGEYGRVIDEDRNTLGYYKVEK